MSLEPIGFITFLVGLFCLLMEPRKAGLILVVTTLFSSAAALFIGANNIQPAHLMLGFTAVTVFTRRREAAAALHSVAPFQAGFWLLCLVLYGVASAVFLPRLLAETTQIVPLGTSNYEDTVGGVPLGPVSSNLTQSVYFIADLGCFCLVMAIASSRAGFETIAAALTAYAAGNALLALLDIATYSTGTQAALEFMRNARYTLHNEEEIAGLKRIVGSFPEASAFARSTLGAFGFTATMWLCGRGSWSGTLALTSLVLLVLSTSSTGLAGTIPVLLILYFTALYRCQKYSNSAVTVIIGPFVVIIALIALILNKDIYNMLYNYVDILLLSKSNSDSGVERSAWNTLGMRNFWDSWGIGVGLGTVRTSSFLVALLASVGVPGVILYLLFIATAFTPFTPFTRQHGSALTFFSDVRLAARNACLGLIIGDSMAAPTIEQGLLFYMLAAMACAKPDFELGERGKMRVGFQAPADMAVDVEN